MARPKFFQAAYVLRKDEWSAFKKFVSTKTRSQSDIHTCIQSIYDNRKQILTLDLAENLRKKHFPRLSSKAYSNMLSKIFGWFEEWLAIYTFESQRYDKELMLVKSYNQRGLFKLADHHYRKLEDRIKDDQLNQEQQKTIAQLYYYQYFSNNPIKVQENDLLQKMTSAHLKYIAQLCLSQIVEHESLALNRRSEKSESVQVLENLNKEFPESIADDKLNKILSQTVQMLKEDNIASHEELKAILKSGILNESSDLQLKLSLYLRKSAYSLWYKGHNTDGKRILDSTVLILQAIESNENQELSPIALYNAVDSLSTLLQHKETESFIDEWIGKTSLSDNEDLRKACQAINCFKHGRYSDTLNLLKSVKINIPGIKNVITIQTIIALYKTDQAELAITLSQNFKRSLLRNRSQLSQSVITRQKNLIEVIINLIKSEYKKEALNKIDLEQPLFYKSWVIKELELITTN